MGTNCFVMREWRNGKSLWTSIFEVFTQLHTTFFFSLSTCRTWMRPYTRDTEKGTSCRAGFRWKERRKCRSPTSWTRSHGSREETRKSVGLFSFFSTGNAICFFSRASWSSCDSVILLAPEGANIAFCVSTKEMSRIATVSREHEAYIGFSGSSWCSRFLRETS